MGAEITADERPRTDDEQAFSSFVIRPWSASSTTTPTWPPPGGERGRPDRPWASPGMAQGTDPMARFGAANSCSAMRPGSHGWPTCASSASWAAPQRCMSQSAWPGVAVRDVRRCRLGDGRFRRSAAFSVSERHVEPNVGTWCHAPVTTSAGRLFDGVAR